MALRHARSRARVLADLQRQRLDHPARVRRRPLHARGPGGRGRVDEGVPHPDRRLLSRRALPRAGARHQVRRRDRRDRRRPRAMPERSPRSSTPHGAGARARPRRSSTRDTMLFLGRHVGYPVALEGALKLKELAYIHAEGFAAGELKHGPIALIDEGTPVVVIVPSPRSRGRCTTRSCPTSRRSGPAARAPSSSPRRATRTSCRTPTT